MTNLWPLQPPPFPGELLSAFLVRASHGHGMSPHRFCRLFLPGEIPIWTRDIDCSAPPALLQEVARLGGFELARANAMILQTPPAVTGNVSMTEREAYFWQWINAVGVYHRSRTRFGLQYCPKCLIDVPTFIRQWRFSFITVCPIHRCTLLDRCRSCGSPVVPHRRSFALTRCHQCGAFLSGVATQLSHPEFEKILAAQEFFGRAMAGESISLGTVVVPAADFLAGAMAILGYLREKLYSYPTLVPLPPNFVVHTPPLRLASRDVRACWFSLLFSVLEDWPCRFIALATSCVMSQAGFSRYRMPGWLGTVVAQLPPRTRSPCGWRRGMLNARVRRIEELGGRGCRADRAEVLMEAALAHR